MKDSINIIALVEEIEGQPMIIRPIIIKKGRPKKEYELEAFEVSACGCYQSCGSNFAGNGKCACYTSCGSNYSR